MQENEDLKGALESIPCEVFSVDELGHKDIEWLYPTVKVLSRDNVHTWARENGGPIEITDEMKAEGASEFYHCGLSCADIRCYHATAEDVVASIYAAMEAKRREGK